MTKDHIESSREAFERAVIARMKESGFLEIEIRVEALVRCGDGYEDEVINAGWHYWKAGIAAASPPVVALPDDATAEEILKSTIDHPNAVVMLKRLPDARAAALEEAAHNLINELSGNPGELIDRMAAAIRDWGSHYDDGPWETLPEDHKAGWRGDAERALAVVKEYLTACLPALEPAVTCNESLQVAAEARQDDEPRLREALADLVGVITDAFPALANTPPVLKARAALKETSDERQ